VNVADDRHMKVVQNFDAFYRAEYRSVARLAHVLTGNLAAGEEIAQEGFLAALKSWEEIGSYESPAGWVRRVVANKAVSRRRRLAIEDRYLAWFRPSEPSELSSPTIDVIDAIRTLSARQAQAIALHYFSDLSLVEVADIMGCSVESVRTHLKRARTRLAELLGDSS